MNGTPTRIRVQFQKLGDLRYTGHIDLQRLFERVLRRSGLPIRYSQGFSPKVRLNLASALPLGYESHAELLDFWMNEPVDLDLVKSALDSALPSQLPVVNVSDVANKAPSLQSSLRASEFLITFPDALPPKSLRLKLESLLAEPELLFENRGKQKDLKTMVLEHEWIEHPSKLRLVMTALPGKTGRPDDLVQMMGVDPLDCHYLRTRLIFEEAND